MTLFSKAKQTKIFGTDRRNLGTVLPFLGMKHMNFDPGTETDGGMKGVRMGSDSAMTMSGGV
jgi:hypothetical protein